MGSEESRIATPRLTTSDHSVVRLTTVVRLTGYQHYIFGGPSVTAFLGRRVALIVDDAAAAGTDAVPVQAMVSDPRGATRVLAILDNVLDLYDATVGRVPVLSCPLHSRVRVEVGYIAAAGLAHHGAYGIAVGPAFLNSMLNAQAQGRAVVHHVFLYEFCRNYIFPDAFTALLGYGTCSGQCKAGCAHDSACKVDLNEYGWVNQGFVDVMGCLLTDSLPGDVEFDYFGSDRRSFRATMERDLETYISSGCSWGEAFMHCRLPWDEARSIDNLYAGLLSRLYEQHGGQAFLRGFFAGIPLLLGNGRTPGRSLGTSSQTTFEDWQTATENFFILCCLGARQDLGHYFVGTLRWPLRRGITGPSGLALLLFAATQ